MRTLTLWVILFFSMPAVAQVDILAPVVGTGDYAFNDTLFLHPEGDDANPGTAALPMKSFAAALGKIPFGTPGINGGHRYGLIILLPGTYHTATGWHQNESQWKQGNTFKNVSLEGWGDVVLTGMPDGTPVSGHALRLMGDHMLVRNLTIRHCAGIGLLISRGSTSPDQPGPAHVLLDNVTVETTGSHGMLIQNADYVQVQHTRVLHASRLDFDSLPVSACSSWPSGLKLHFSRHITIRDCEVAYTRGEGLNFHNCQNALAEGNHLHDNPTNLYNDNSAGLIVRGNYIYNTPGWTDFAHICPQNVSNPTLLGTGILLANEGSCLAAQHTPTFDNCLSRCLALPAAYTFPTIDSVFIYNNLFQNCGRALSFWQGNVDIVGRNCIRNVFVVHNTIIGVAGDAGVAGSAVRFFFPDANPLINTYSQMTNVRFYGNIFSYDAQEWPLHQPVAAVFNPLVAQDVAGSFNVWNENHPYLGAQDIVNTQLPGTASSPDTAGVLWPCALTNPEMVYAIPSFAAWLNTDLLGNPRQAGLTNAGAVEYNCALAAHPKEAGSAYRIYPNPGGDRLWLDAPVGASIQVYDGVGRRVYSGITREHPWQMDLTGRPSGVYTVWLIEGNKRHILRWVKM